MKRVFAVCALVVILCGCEEGQQELESALELRQKILAATECRFEAEITADYGDKLYAFSTDCSVNSQGDLSFRVTAPETIAGISGIIEEAGGKLTFDESALSFPLLAEGLLSPVSAPWIVMKTLRGGYIRSAGKEAGGMHLTIDDSYLEDALQLDIWLDGDNMPERADILHNGCRILLVHIRNFQIL